MTLPVVAQRNTSDSNSPNAAKPSGSSILEYPIGLVSAGLSDERGPYMVITAYDYERKIQSDSNRASTKFRIYLPLPAGISSSFSASYGQNTPGLKGAAFDTASQNKSGVAAAAAGAIGYAGAAVVEQAAKRVLDTLASMGGGTGSEISAALQSPELAGLASATAGVTINPRTETIFQGINLRNHSFSLTAVPRSEAETVAIKNIIKEMTIALHPELTGATTILKYPYEFTIGFCDQDGAPISVIPSVPDSFLTSFSVTFNPGGQSRLLKNNTPASYQISMSFVEGIALTREDLKYISSMFNQETA